MKTLQLVEALKTLLEVDSDYAIAKKLGVSHTALGKWRKGSTMDDNTALYCADLLGLDPLETLAGIQLERALNKGDNQLIKFWSRYAPKIGKNEFLSLAM